MKVCASAIFLVTILSVNGKVFNTKDPKKYVNCEQKNKVLWPDYSDKKNYFECVGDDYFVKRPCPNKTVFSYKIQECTWPEDWIKPPELDNLIEREFSPSCAEFELHLLWPNPENPQEYFRCTEVGENLKFTCRSDRVFNFSAQMCVLLEATSTTELNVDRFPDCFENELHLTWPDPWYPENFYMCTGIGEFELRGCPPGRFFMFMLQMCVTEEEIPAIFPMETVKEVQTAVETTTGFPNETATRSLQESTSSVSFITATTSQQTEVATESLQAAHTTSYPKLKCLICWRPTCEASELHLEWPDYDNERNYFKCLSEGVLTLKPCQWGFVFDFKDQTCVEQDNRV